MSDHYMPVAERCEQQASLLTDEGRHEVATVLWEADALIRSLEAENGRLRSEAQSKHELLRECQTEFKALGSKGLVETIEFVLTRKWEA